MRRILIAILMVLRLCSLSASQDAASAKSFAALKDTFPRVIQQTEPSLVCLYIARGEPYEMAPVDCPGKLGVFPSGPKERDAARKSPQLDPAHPRFLPEHQATGVVIDPSGLIVTTFRAVREARKIYAVGQGVRAGFADILAADQRSNLAVLKLLDAKTSLRSMKMATADLSAKGDMAFALGFPRLESPQELAISTVSGMVNQLASTVHGPLWRMDRPLPQVTAGWALVNGQGELIGLTTDCRDVNAAGVEALPLDAVRQRILTVLQSGAEVEYGFLGVNTEDLTAGQLSALNVADGGAARVTEEPAAGTPAAKAGVHKGDILMAVNGRRVRKGQDLTWEVGSALVGASADLDLIRDRRRITVRVAELAKAAILKPIIVSKAPPAVEGLRVDYLTVLLDSNSPAAPEGQERVLSALRHGGVVVREVQRGTAAERAGLQMGDILIEVNDRPIECPAEFYREVMRSTETISVTLPPLESPGSPPRKVRLR